MQLNCCRETELWWATPKDEHRKDPDYDMRWSPYFVLHKYPPPPQIDIDGERLVCEPVIKDLGVYLDQHMTCSRHVDHLVRQRSGTLCYIHIPLPIVSNRAH